MPKKILDQLVRGLMRDITSTRKVGDHYLTLNETCRKFGVSYKVAQKAMKELAQNGMVCTTQNSGSTILSPDPVLNLSNRTIVVVSCVNSKEFTKGFMQGVGEVANSRGMHTELVVEIPPEVDTTTFGDFLLALKCDGVIALGFAKGAIGFCHAINKGLDIVADTPLAELPYLPSAYTDNFGHCRRAGERLRNQGAEEVLVVTTTDITADTHRGFMKQRFQGLLAGLEGSATRVTVVPLYEPRATDRIDAFMEQFGAGKAIFSMGTDSNFVVASKCYQHGVTVTDENLLIYNSAEETVSFYGLPQLRTVGPSRKQVGVALARKLIYKWEHGRYKEPLWEKV